MPHHDSDARPVVIQGGMSVGISSWRLARAVSRCGQLGVVAGTAVDIQLARRLQDGDPGGHLRRALAACPLTDLAARVLTRWFRPAGREGRPYAPVPRLALRPRRLGTDLLVAGAFAEVWLAKEGHEGLVGFNLMEKIQMATPAALYGAMLAGADYVIMGAGVPRDIPSLLAALARNEPGAVSVDVAGGAPRRLELDPRSLTDGPLPTLRRPLFLAIVSSHVLAAYLHREEAVRPDGFVVEGHVAGGHSAPPRGSRALDATGQPVYGPRDEANLAQLAALGVPFWLAGGYGTPERVAAAIDAGAAGVQAGSLFLLAHESGLLPELRAQVLARLRAGTLDVRTEPLASPTGFPFKVAQLPGTVSDPATARPRRCDLGFLRVPYARVNGAVGYRCPAEPVEMFTRKGGDAARAEGATCLCNATTATVGLGQEPRDGRPVAPIVTVGTDLAGLRALQAATSGPGGNDDGWPAEVAVEWLLGEVRARAAHPAA